MHDLAAGYLTGCADTPAGWAQVLSAAAANLGQGFGNAILVEAQNPGAGLVATYDEWKAAGWQVRRGVKAAAWITPGQQPVPVYTRDQVRPARTGTAPPLPGVSSARASSAEQVAGALTACARRRGYSVTRDEDAAQPWTDRQQRRIIVPASLPPAAAAAALAHQLGHVETGSSHPAGGGRDGGGCRGTQAVEADSVAWLVLARLGLDPRAARITFPAAREWAAPDRRSPLVGVLTAAGNKIARAAAEVVEHAGKVMAELPPPPEADRILSQPGRPAAPVSSGPPWPYPDQDLVRVNTAAAAFFRSHLDGSWAAEYLEGRGFGPAICRRWQLGYAPPGWTGLLDHLRALGFKDSVIEAAGLASTTRRGSLADVFRDRVMIPVRGHHGQVIAFAGRAREGAPEETPKYLNTRRTSIYSKDHVLYGLAESGASLAAGARPVLVEGYFDVIAVTEAGRGARLAGVAPCGTAFSSHQMDALYGACDLRGNPLLVARDPDGPGVKASVRDYQIMGAWRRAAGTPNLPAGQDPAKIFQLRGPAGLAEALTGGEHPLADVAVDAVLAGWAGKLQWAEGQLGAVRAVARLMAQAPPADPVRQIARVAEATGVPHQDVAGEFAQVIAELGVLPPKGTGLAGASPGSRRHVPATADFPAAPAPGHRPRVSRRGGTPPRLPGARPPPRRH